MPFMNNNPPRDRLADNELDIGQAMNELLKAEKSIEDMRLHGIEEVLKAELDLYKKRQDQEQKIQDAAIKANAKFFRDENKRYIEARKNLAKEQEKLTDKEYKQRLVNLDKEHKAKIKEIKDTAEFQAGVDKAAAKERKKLLVEAEKAAAKELLASSKNGTGLINGLKNAFTGDDSSFDKSKGVNALWNAVGDIAKQLDNSIESISSKKGIIDTNLQGSRRSTGGLFGIGNSYWDNINRNLTGIIGMSPLVKRESVVNNLQAMVSRGVAFDVEQRAFLETIKDKIATTFDANNAALSRLIRLQQQDTTAARLGMESALTAFLNNMYETSEYMHEVASSIKSTLEEAESLMGAQSAAAFEYEVQKWMGSMYSVGMSSSAVSSISSAIGQIAAGKIEGLGSGSSNLVIMAANNAGLSISDMLANGLNDQTTNILLNAMVKYLAGIYDETKGNNVVQQQFANVFGISASDLKSAANLNSSRNQIAKSTLSYNGMLSQLNTMANSMYNRTSTGELLGNTWNNLQYNMAAGIANNPILYGIYKAAGLLDAVAGGIALPDISVLGNSVALHTNVADLMRVGALSGSILDSIALMASSGSFGGFSGSAMLKALGANKTNTVSRGTGLGFLGKNSSNMSISESGYIGNAEEGAVYNKTMSDSDDDKKKVMAEAQEDSDDVTMNTVNENVVAIFNLLQSVTNGTKQFTVTMGNEALAWNQ